MSDDKQPSVIAGFGDLEQEIAEALKTVKASENNVAALWKAMAEHPVVSMEHNELMEARRHLSIGFILLARAVSLTDDPFSFHQNPHAPQSEGYDD